MTLPWSQNYIPIGCVDVSTDELSLNNHVYPKPHEWNVLSRPQKGAKSGIDAPSIFLAEAQAALLKSKDLRSMAPLWKNEWIQISFRIMKSPERETYGRLRIYVLPFDIDRNAVAHRDDEKLIKSLAALLRQLDYSPETWNGNITSNILSQPKLFNGSPSTTTEDDSLLAMFNSVPSPDPQPSTIADWDARNAMVSILESTIPGLQTTLFPYQRRSAALMLQRELVPGRTLDPRFRHCRSQDDRAFYYDSVTGTILSTPRYYDGIRGGILAEEMGTGKTLICLSLILSTLREPASPPEPFVAEIMPRKRMASLADMAAGAANKGCVAWRPYFDFICREFKQDHEGCIRVLRDPKNRAFYKMRTDPLVEPRRSSRFVPREPPTKRISLGCGTLVVAPDNLVTQWREEIRKHTVGLDVLVLLNRDPIPSVSELLGFDLVLVSQSRLEWIWGERKNGEGPMLDIYCPLEHVQWKRSVVDEGHKLGSRSRSSAMLVLDGFHISAKWIVTGTPTRNLYGVNADASEAETETAKRSNDIESQKNDLVHIGKMVSKYFKVRPWANTREEVGDMVADWNIYVMNKSQHSKGQNRLDTLKTTLDALIIRHRLADVSMLLPAVDEKIVYLEGSYQDKIALNLFYMMIIFNAVQSERTDVDYFFHPRQRKNLADLVRNLRQACFFGGVFFSRDDIQTSLDIAEKFLTEKKILISPEDEQSMREAIEFGKIAVSNTLKSVSNQFHSLPLYLENFPGGSKYGKSWSLDGAEEGPVCIDAGLVHSLQKYLNPCIDAPMSLKRMMENGGLDLEGQSMRQKALEAAEADTATSNSLAGSTKLGSDKHAKPKSGLLEKSTVTVPVDGAGDGVTDRAMMSKVDNSGIMVADALASTRIVSTVSAKLSYLIDQIVQHKDDEQIIVFYDNDNIAWYLGGVLEILQIEHLIYTRAGLSASRRAQYVATFTHNPLFRVLLMDISQAAFGLDMRSASRIYFITPVLNPQVQAQAIGRARRISQSRPVTVETLVLKDSIEEVVVRRGREMTQSEQRKVAGVGGGGGGGERVVEDRVVSEWIRNVKILPLTQGKVSGKAGAEERDSLSQTAMLKTPQFVFGRGFGRELHPDEGLITDHGNTPKVEKVNPEEGMVSGSVEGAGEKPIRIPFKLRGLVRGSPSPMTGTSTRESTPVPMPTSAMGGKKKKVGFSVGGDDTAMTSSKGDVDAAVDGCSGAEDTVERPKKKVRVAWVDDDIRGASGMP